MYVHIARLIIPSLQPDWITASNSMLAQQRLPSGWFLALEWALEWGILGNALVP